MSDLEVVVYDDGSDDMDGFIEKKGKVTKLSANTEKVLAKFKDSRLKYVKCKDNHGAAYSRNRLMELAEGEFAMWLDSDDVANKHRAALSIEAIVKYGANHARTAVTTYTRDCSTWTKPPLVIWTGGKVSFATTTFRTSCKMEFDTGYKHCCEDMDWELRFSKRFGPAVLIPLSLYGIGKTAQDRLTSRGKFKVYSEKYEQDVAKYKKKKGRILEYMENRGIQRCANAVPWSFIDAFLKSTYNRYYVNQVKE